MRNCASTASCRFKYTYTDSGGHTETKVVGFDVLNSLYGAEVQVLLTRESFVRLTIEIGNRKAVIEPAKSEGKGTR